MKKYRHAQGTPSPGKTQYAGLDSIQWWSTYLKEAVPPHLLENALCRESEVSFFPGRGQDTSAACAICRECPVRVECLELSCRNREPEGVWGGIPAGRRKKWLKAEVSPGEMIRLYDSEQAEKTKD